MRKRKSFQVYEYVGGPFFDGLLGIAARDLSEKVFEEISALAKNPSFLKKGKSVAVKIYFFDNKPPFKAKKK